LAARFGLTKSLQIEVNSSVLVVGRVDAHGERGSIELGGLEFQTNVFAIGGEEW
jgi:hypothetical protein